MLTITESTEISAPCNLVWHTLSDLGGYHLWNSFMIPRRGSFVKGGTLELRLRPPFSSHIFASPLISKLREGKSFTLSGPELLPGSLTGALTCELTPLSMESVRITQTMEIQGFMVQYREASLLKTWSYGLSIMNSELKLRTETLYDEALMRTSYDTLPALTRPTLTVAPLPASF